MLSCGRQRRQLKRALSNNQRASNDGKVRAHGEMLSSGWLRVWIKSAFAAFKTYIHSV
jgi:hypothetical protein